MSNKKSISGFIMHIIVYARQYLLSVYCAQQQRGSSGSQTCLDVGWYAELTFSIRDVFFFFL